MLTIYVMRHGETMLNLKGLVQGWSDSELTEGGIEVVKEAGIKLSHISFTSIFVSDLSRTLETAKIILKENKYASGLPIMQLPGLKEVHFGKYESRPDPIMWNAAFKALGIHSFDVVFKRKGYIKEIVNAIANSDETGGTENYEQVSKRIMDAFKTICDEADNEGNRHILIVSHGTAIGVLLNELGFTLKGPLKNAGITTIIYENGNYQLRR